MRIYYTRNFSGTEEDSRHLLGMAMDKFIRTENPEWAASPEEILASLENGPKGKPYTSKFLPFSISHSGNLWAVLIDRVECGLDIQRSQKAKYKALAMRFYTGDEAVSVFQKGENEFFRIWTRREAYRKAKGESVFSEEESVLFDRINDDGRIWEVKDLLFPLPVYAAVCRELVPGKSTPEDFDHLVIEAL